MVRLAVDDVAPFEDWTDAVRGTLAFLHTAIGLDVWMLTEVQGDLQIVRHAHPRELVPSGTVLPWDRSFCRKMVSGAGPRVSTVTVATPEYANLVSGHLERVAAYVGVPVVARSGEVFGTLCGVAARAQPRSFARNLPLVELVTRLLATLLPADADDVPMGQGVDMTTPTPDLPQPRDIALEQETPGQAADLEAASDPEQPAPEPDLAVPEACQAVPDRQPHGAGVAAPAAAHQVTKPPTRSG